MRRTKRTRQFLQDLFDYASKTPDKELYRTENGMKLPDISLPAYNYFENPTIVTDIWCLHYTNLESFEDICERGFRKGTSNMDHLAYTARYREDDIPKTTGWNFAIPLDNKSGYYGEDLGYGDCGFLIKTDGVKVYHKVDNDDEVIFRNCHVSERHPFMYDEDAEGFVLYDVDIDVNNLPEGAEYNEEFDVVLFKSVKDMCKYIMG